MAIDLVSRSEWNARTPTGQYSRMPDPVSGVKVHYTGGFVNPNLLTNHSLCDNAVRGIQNGHMDGNDWMDIGYSFVACHHRKVFVGRGKGHIPAANGPGLNSQHYAVLGLVGNSGLVEPSEGLLHGIRDAIEYLREETGARNQIRGHRDGYATACPGSRLYAWVKEGAPRPNTQPAPVPPVVPQGEEMDVVSLGLTQNVELPTGVNQPWWTDEFSDASEWHPANGQSIAPSVPAWGDFVTQLHLSAVQPETTVEISFVRTNPLGEFVDTAWGPFYRTPDPDGTIEFQMAAQFKLNGTTRARVQISHNQGAPISLNKPSMFKAFLFRD